MDALRAEFPGTFAALERVQRISIPRAGVWQAFVAGIGAAFVVRAIAQLAVTFLYPIAFPATVAHPTWVTPGLFSNGAGELAAGLVLVAAGGLRPLALYVTLELLVLVTALPSRLLFCSRAGSAFTGVPCDLPGMIADRWPLWLALALGAVAARVVASPGEGESHLFRAAGAFSLVVTIVTNVTSAAYTLTGATPSALTLDGIFAVGQILAGVAAGVLLWQPKLARAVLLAVCLVGPSFAVNLPPLRADLQGAVPNNLQPSEYYLVLWAGLFIPVAAVIALFAGRAFRREWGTFF